MKVTWFSALRNWFSLLVVVLITLIPIFVFSYFWVKDYNSKKMAKIDFISTAVLADFEVVLDHVNGALINLQTSFSHCDLQIQDLMDKLSFDLPGVEGFALFDQHDRLLCTNWLQGNASIHLPLQGKHSGLHLSGEEYFSAIGKTGVVVFRLNGVNGKVVAYLSSTYLRQTLNRNIAIDDTLVLYNRDINKQIAMNGLLSANQLANIVKTLLPTKSATKNVDRNLSLTESSQYPAVQIAYFTKPLSIVSILKLHWFELLLCFSMSSIGALAWLALRVQKVNSYKYQLQLGLASKEFEPYLQPIVDMRTGQWIGAETLTRWLRHGDTVAYPDEFIVAAEKAGFIKAITYQVTEKLCNFVNQLPAQKIRIYYSINLSPNFIDHDTILSIRHFQKTYQNIKPDCIRFEITEHGLAKTNQIMFSEIVEQLRNDGFMFGLDDFGTGQSGLEYFSNITPDFLKIDRRFVNAIGTPDSVDFQILKTILQLAKSLDLMIIAEGVESEQERDWLIQQGIHCGQGWLYQKAVPLPEFQRLLAKQIPITPA